MVTKDRHNCLRFLLPLTIKKKNKMQKNVDTLHLLEQIQYGLHSHLSKFCRFWLRYEFRVGNEVRFGVRIITARSYPAWLSFIE